MLQKCLFLTWQWYLPKCLNSIMKHFPILQNDFIFSLWDQSYSMCFVFSFSFFQCWRYKFHWYKETMCFNRFKVILMIFITKNCGESSAFVHFLTCGKSWRNHSPLFSNFSSNCKTPKMLFFSFLVWEK